jgi:hypothetical protein
MLVQRYLILLNLFYNTIIANSDYLFKKNDNSQDVYGDDVYGDDDFYDEVSGYDDDINGDSVNEITLQPEMLSVLRRQLFTNYSRFDRPVKDSNDPVILEYGIEIKSLEYFDQKAENIKFNTWVKMVWYDEYLKWDEDDFPRYFISVSENDIWTPDLELYNAASRPINYDLKGSMKLYSDGKVLWIRPIAYSFSCKLDLVDFPFDKQSCQMTFGSWQFNKDYLDLYPFDYHKDKEYKYSEINEDSFNNVSISDEYYHNEWEIINFNVSHKDYEYLCCPGELWPNSVFTVSLQRNYHKFLVVMAMTMTLVITGLVIFIFKATQFLRFYILVFVPLTIIWLQINISSKIPIIAYSTHIESFIILSYVTIIISAIQSGILYNIYDASYKLTLFIRNYCKNGLYNFDFAFRGILIISYLAASIYYFI